MTQEERSIRKAKIINYTLLFFIICIVAICFSIYKYNHTLSTQRWISHPNERFKMVDSMLRQYDFLSKTKEQVIEILGDETSHPYFKNSNNLVYYLGDEPSFFISIDSEWLVITFTDNLAVSAEIMRD